MDSQFPDRSFDSKDETELRVALRRCSEETYLAAREFRVTGSPAAAKVAFIGILERFTDRQLRPRLQTGDESLSLKSDLGMDSLTLMELVMVAEDVFRVSIPNEELSNLRTVGDATRLVETHLKQSPTSRNWSGLAGHQPSIS